MAPRKGRAAVAHPTPGAPKAVSPLPPVACKPGLAAVPAGGDVYTVDGVLTDGECRLLIQAAEALGFAHQGSRGPAAGEAVRDNGRLALADARWAAGLWRVLRPAVVGALPQADAELAVGLYDHIRVYRYAPGQVFGRHYDDAIAVGPGLRTRFTLLVYLSAVEAGGETVFYGQWERRGWGGV